MMSETNSIPAICSEVEQFREGFRQIRIRAVEKNDLIAYAVAQINHKNADKLIVSMGGESVLTKND